MLLECVNNAGKNICYHMLYEYLNNVVTYLQFYCFNTNIICLFQKLLLKIAYRYYLNMLTMFVKDVCLVSVDLSTCQPPCMPYCWPACQPTCLPDSNFVVIHVHFCHSGILKNLLTHLWFFNVPSRQLEENSFPSKNFEFLLLNRRGFNVTVGAIDRPPPP